MKLLCLHFIILLLFSGSFIATAVQKHTPIAKKLGVLKENNDLTSWLYARIEYCVEKPQQRLAFLMLTQSHIWRKPLTVAEREAWLNLLLNQGYYQLYSGHVLSSIKQYEQAYSFFLDKPIKGFNLVEYLLKPLGNNYTRLGDYTNALFIHQKSLTISLASLDSQAIAASYSNLAISYKSVGNLHDAEKACLNGFRYVKRNDILLGLLKSTLAEINYENGKFAAAYHDIQQAISILSVEKQSSNKYYWLLSAYTLAGNIAANNNRQKEALNYYHRGLSVIETRFKGGRIREKANLLNRSAEVYLTANPQKSLNYYNQSVRLLTNKSISNILKDDLYEENKLYDALEGVGKADLALGNPKAALNFFLLALYTGDKARNEYADDKDRQFYQKVSKGLAESAIETAYNLWDKTHENNYALVVLEIAEHTKARTLLDQIQHNKEYAALNQKDPDFKRKLALERALIYYGRELLIDPRNAKSLNPIKRETQYQLSLLNNKLRNKYPALHDADNKQEIPVAELIKKVPKETTAIAFFCGRKAIYTIAIQQGRITQIKRLRDADLITSQITSFVNGYFRNGPSAMANYPRKFFNESNHIYSLLFGNLLSDTHKNLVIIPDDVLGYLPFEAFITSSRYSLAINKWPFLINNYKVSYGYSLQSLYRPINHKTHFSKPFSGFFIKESKGKTSIPAVVLEEKSIRKLLRGNYLVDNEATLQKFREALNTSQILHISTHSFMYGKLSEPALQMADGNYFLLELATQQQIPSLVVLSACRTADGVLAEGEGVLSLARGFTAAGANGIIAGLWNVNDRAGAELMAQFYTHLQRGQNSSEALYQAKKNWIKCEQPNSVLFLPYYWASMVYVGEPQQLITPTPFHSYYYYYLAGCLLLIFAGLGIIILKKMPKS